jgi:RNA polymerase sigma factor (sigma-70 family)
MKPGLYQYTDDQLVTEAKAGNNAAAEILFVRHKTFVSRLVKQFGGTAEEIKDTTQDIFIRVWEHLHGFEQQSSFTTWLYRITVNHVLQSKRKEKSQQRQITSGLWLEEEDSEDSMLPENFLIDYFSGALLCLSEEQRIALVLADIFRMDHVQASYILKITPDAYRKRLSRSRKDLRNWISKKCSLLTPGNTCQCPKKKQCFIDEGKVNERTGKFERDYIRKVQTYIAAHLEQTGTADFINFQIH